MYIIVGMRPSTRPDRLLRNLLLLWCTLVLMPGLSGADHEASEPSDGTVRSFRALDVPRPVPKLRVLGPDGNPVPLAAFRGRIVLLNLWATWCPPCIRELPALDRLNRNLSGDAFEVVAVSLDAGGRNEAQPFFDRLGIDSLVLYSDPGKTLAEFFPVDVLPASFIIDRDGRVTHFLRSYVDWDDPLAYEFIALLAAGR
jgi:thiol-disulfide isomerase/thioredoxin